MREYHRRRVEVQSTFDHLPGMHLGAVNRAGEERFMGNQLILVDAPRDKCAHFREINGIAAAFQYLQKNYNPTAPSSL